MEKERRLCEDPRGRRFVLSRVDEFRSRGSVVLINRWPTGKHPAQLIASSSHVDDLIEVMRYKIGSDACITAHATPGCPTPCLLVAHRSPDVVKI